MMLTTSVIIVAYILWSISPEVARRLNTEYLYLSAGFLVLDILRFMQIALVEEKSGIFAKILLRDRFIQLTLIGWVGVFIWVLYLGWF
jgi:hypothetical protein